MHGLALFAGTVNGLPFLAKVLLSILVCLSLWLNLKRLVLEPEDLTVKFSETGGWQLGSEAEGFSAIHLEGSTVSTPFFIILHTKRNQEPGRTILIVKDAVTAEDFRKLRVALKITGP